MSDFFKHFPVLKHNGKVVTDITRRVKVLEKLGESPFLYQPYTIKMNETPEDIAYYYYGDIGMSWLVLLANNIINPDAQWPKSIEKFETYVANKYLQKYKEFLYATKPSRFQKVRDLMQEMFDFRADRSRFDNPLPFAELQAGSAKTIPDSYEDYWNYISTSAASDINADGLINNVDSQQLLDTETWEGEFKRYLLELYEVPDMIRTVTDFTRDPTINDNVVYYEGQFDGEQPKIRWNNETWYNNSYAEEGAIEFGYSQPLGADWSVVRIWDYEDAINENQRSIRLVDAQYLQQVKRELRGMYV